MSKTMYVVCENPFGEKCNVHGTNYPGCGGRDGRSCGSGSESFCKPGYTGRRCDKCSFGASQVASTVSNHNFKSHEGIKCKCK